MSEEIEKVKCAAMVWRGRVHEGKAHADIIHRLAATIPKEEWPVVGLQGFVTTRGTFVDRGTALYFAREAGQIVKQHHPNELFSEDFVSLYEESVTQ